MSFELSFLDKLVEDLIKTKRNNYSQQCINFYVDEKKYSIEDISGLYNHTQEKIKCTLIRHRVNQKYKIIDPNANRICIVYVHGLGSSRLQSLSLIQHLPIQYSFCMFDTSGSGKSDGEYVTYGLKQQYDIQSVINFLFNRKSIKTFVVWGRSMGAVSTLLYAIGEFTISKNRQSPISLNQTLMNSRASSYKQFSKLDDKPQITAIILDSPFQNFRDIAKEVVSKKLLIPQFLIDIAIGYVEESLERILSQTIGSRFNPFKIAFDNRISLSIPIIFMYSQKDQVIPFSHCQKLIKHVDSRYERLLINQCTHNQTRPAKTIVEIFKKLDKFQRISNYSRKVNNQNRDIIRQDSTKSQHASIQRKRGIFVYTPSKQIKRQSPLCGQRQSPHVQRPIIKFHQHVNIDVIRTEQMHTKSPLRKSLQKKKIITTISALKNSQKNRQLSTISTNKNYIPTSIDTETTRIINKKLIQMKELQSIGMKNRPKRFGTDRKQEYKMIRQRNFE